MVKKEMIKYMRRFCSFIVLFVIIAELAPSLHGMNLAGAEQTDAPAAVVYSSRERDAVTLLHALGILDTADMEKLRLEEEPTRAEVAALCIRALGVDVKLSDPQTDSDDGTDSSAEIDSENIKHALDKYAELLLDERGIASVKEAEQIETSIFSDIPTTHWAYEAIKYGVAMKLISGYPGGEFKPDAAISKEEAVKILVCLVGCQPLAELQGGYPAGYSKEAAQAGIRILSGEFDRMAFLRMLADTLKIPVLKQKSFGAKAEYKAIDGITLMSEMFDVSEGNGQIIANCDARLGANYAAEGDVIIGETAYHIGETEAYDYIGYRCTYYARTDQNHECTLIALTDLDDNKVITVTSENVVSVSGIQSASNGRLVYFDEEAKKEKRLNISPTAVYIYNGGELATVQDSDLIFETGYITLIDSDNDGLYDVVSVIQDEIYWVDEADTGEETIIDRFSGERIDFNQDTVDAKVTIVKGDRKDVGFDEIVDYDIIAVEKSRKASGENILKIVIVEQRLTGKITMLKQDSVYFDGVAYQKAPSLDVTFQLQIGEVYNCFFDTLGRVAAVVKETDGDDLWTYGYLIKYKRLSDDFDTYNKFVIMTTDGAKSYATDQNTRLNGKKTDAQPMVAALQSIAAKLVRPELPDEAAGAIITHLEENGLLRQLVQFKETDGILSDLRTAQVKDEYSAAEKTYDLDHFSLDYKTTGSESGATGTDDDSDWIYRNYTYHYGEQYLADVDAVCFSIPQVTAEIGSSGVYTGRAGNLEMLLDENEYIAGTRSIFLSNRSTYQNVELYDADVDYNVKSMVIKVTEPYGFSEVGVSVYIANGISEELDEWGDPCYVINYINSSGNAGKFYFDDPDLECSGAWGYAGVKIMDLKRGDVFFVRRGTDGKVKNLAIIFRAPQQGNPVDDMFKFSEDTNGTIHSSSNTRIHSANYFSYSPVIDRAPNTLVVEGRGAGGNRKSVGFTGASMVLTIEYDMKRGKLTTRSYSDISKNDRVLVWAAYLVPKLFIIYK